MVIGTAPLYGIALIRALLGDDKANEIQKAMLISA